MPTEPTEPFKFSRIDQFPTFFGFYLSARSPTCTPEGQTFRHRKAT